MFREKPRPKTKKDKQFNDVWWKCTYKFCSASLITDLKLSKIIRINANHKEECPDVSKKSLQYRKISSSVKRKAEEDLDEKPESLITKRLRASDSKNQLGNEDLVNLKKTVWRVRNKQTPAKLQRNAGDCFDQIELIKNKNAWMTGMNEHKKEQFIYPFKTLGILIITSITNLLWLCDPANEHYLGDGTFSYCPMHFAQLYTIHAYRSGYYIPLVHIALPGKSEAIYDKMWYLLKHLCYNLCGKVLSIRSMVVDYELAAINSVANEFPGVTIRGCRFHLSQSWFRFIQTFKGFDYLSHYNTKDSAIGKWLRAFFGLSYLPPELIDEAFFMLHDRKPSADCDKFIDYICENYIDISVANYGPLMWAGEVSDVRDVRTTNGPESFHMGYNSNFNRKHPNIFKVLNVLLCNQEKNYLSFNDINNGLEKKQRNPRIKADNETRNLWNNYKTSQRTEEDLWKYLCTVGNRFKGRNLSSKKGKEEVKSN